VLTIAAVGSSPELSILPTESATRFAEMGVSHASLNSLVMKSDVQVYTVIMADADIPGTDFAANPQTRHWLVNTVSVQAEGEGPYPLNFTGSTAM
jgi:hypothetical protein